MEIIVALAIGAVLLITIGAVLNATVRGTEQMRAVMDRTRLECGIERLLRRDLELAFTAEDRGVVFFGQTPSGDGMFMEFTSLSSYDPGRTPPAGLVRVEYSLASSEGESGGWQLRRREMVKVPGKPADRSSAQPEPLADGVSGVQLAFYDGVRWQDKWRRDTLPALVRMQLRFAQAEKVSQTEKVSDTLDVKVSDTFSEPQVEYCFRPCVSPGAKALP